MVDDDCTPIPDENYRAAIPQGHLDRRLVQVVVPLEAIEAASATVTQELRASVADLGLRADVSMEKAQVVSGVFGFIEVAAAEWGLPVSEVGVVADCQGDSYTVSIFPDAEADRWGLGVAK